MLFPCNRIPLKSLKYDRSRPKAKCGKPSENRGRAAILALLCKQTTFEQVFWAKKLKDYLLGIVY